jgi:hypothetical protein
MLYKQQEHTQYLLYSFKYSRVLVFMPILIHVGTLSHTYAQKIMGQNMYSCKTHFCLKPAYHLPNCVMDKFYYTVY